MTDGFLSLQGRTAIVTGGSRGIGRAIAMRLAAAGAHVTIVYRNSREDAEAAVATIAAAGGSALALAGDAADGAAARGIIEQTVTATGRLDILVNNAAISDNTPFLALEEEQWERAVAVNIGGLYHFTRPALEVMREARYGRVLNIGSVCGVRPIAAVPVHYAMTKGAMQAFTWTLAREVARYGVTVNSIAPGLIETEFAAGLPIDRIRDFERFCPMGRPGTVDEVADLALFMVSERNAYMTGETVVVSGGL